MKYNISITHGTSKTSNQKEPNHQGVLCEPKKISKVVTLLLLALLFLNHSGVGQEASKKQWSYTLGLGIGVVPSYLGDNDYQTVLFPNFRAVFSDKFFVSLFDGMGYNVIKTNFWKVGPIVKYNVGRYENGSVPSRIAGEKTTDLIGMGDVNFTIEPGVFIERTTGSFVTRLELRQGIGGHKGLIGELKSEYRNTFKALNRTIFYAVGPQLRIADSNFNSAFFGVDQTQSIETGLDLYQPSFGILSYGLNGSVIVPLNDKINTIVFAGYHRLGDVASHSELIQKYGSSHQGTLGVSFNYSF